VTQRTWRTIALVVICVMFSAVSFAAPAVTSLSPQSGVVGTYVTISGTGFGAVPSDSTVSLNGISVAVVSWSDTSLFAAVPAGATSGPFVVTVSGQAGSSSTFTVTALPTGWTDTDIGAVGLAGSATDSGGTFTVKGAGQTIGGTADGFHFAYQPLSGDGWIIARVGTLQGTSSPQAGVMIRESLNSGSTDAFVDFFPNQGYLFYRTSTGGNTSSLSTGFVATAYPYWVKLARAGNVFTGYVSLDGFNWTQIGSSATVVMAQSVYIGLAVSSQSTSTLETATFDNVSVNSTASPAPLISTLSATTGAIGSQVTITGSNFGTAQGASVVLLNGAPVTVNSWSDTSIVFTLPAGATSGFLVVSKAPSMNNSNRRNFAVTTQPLPSSWLDQDIGVATTTGSATYSHGIFTLKAAGASIGGTADGLHFVYRPLSGDGSIVARVSTLQGPASAGVMIREGLTSNSTHAFVDFFPNQAYLLYRSTTGANTSSWSTAYTSTAYPYWVKLARSGNTFSAFISPDGSSWTQVGGNVTIAMSSNSYVGLAVSSGGSATLATATFDSVSVNSSAAPAPTITSLSATTGSIGSQVTISGANFGGTQGGSLVLLNGAPVTINTWADTSILFTIPAGATSGPIIVAVAPSMNESNPVAFAVTNQPLPAYVLNRDVGIVKLTGSATYSSGVFTVKGAGNSVFGTNDAFQYVYQSLAGDGSIVARVTNLQGASAPLAGVMIRESLADNSAHAFAYFSPSQAVLYTRASTGASTTSQTTPFIATAYPYWVKLVRSANSFTGFISPDGVNWTQIGNSVTISIAQTVLVGLALSSNAPTTLETATFDCVSINSATAPAPAIVGLSATTASVGSQVEIFGSNFGTAQGGSAVFVNGVPMNINYWTDTWIVFTVPTGATSGVLVVAKAPNMNDSNPVMFAVTAQPLPGPWLDQDIGVVGLTGSATYSGGVFTVKGAGQIGGTADKLHFVYQSLWGDGSIIARVASLQGTGSPQVGVMVRETLTPGATDAFVFFQPNQADLFTRATTGGSNSTQLTSFVSAAAPYWVRLIRNGNTFSAYISANGTNWTQVGTNTTVTMAQNVYIGLAVSSQSVSTLETATFDNVSVTVGSTPFISSLSPIVGGVGTAVTLTGSNFGTTQGTSTVQFNGASSTSILSWSGSQIVAAVPSAVPPGTGPVTVTVNSITSNANLMFTAVNPIITSVSPSAGAPGGSVTINGSGFGNSGGNVGNDRVYFNGLVAYVVSWSTTSIQVYVPTGATTGPVTITESGVTSNGVQFTVEGLPVVSGISPGTGAIGSSVTITGTGFGSIQSSSSVAFYGFAAAITSWSDTQIVATVPVGTVTGPVSVTVAGLTGWGPSFTLEQTAYLTDSLGNQSIYTSVIVGGAWNLLQMQGPGCSSCTVRGNVQHTYDANSNVLSTTDANGHTTSYTYDSANNMLSQTAHLDDGTPVATSYTYNSFSEVLTMTDPLGHVTTNTYDTKGNLLTVTSPAPNGQTSASVTQFAYDTKGRLTQITDPLNHITTLAYYPTGQIQSITDAQNHVTSYAYDARGNRTSVIDPINGSAHPTTFAYDIMNRLTDISYPDNTSVSFGYDSRGRRISATDQNNKTTTYAYDDADHLISVTDAANHLTTYAYDTENNLTSITDGNNHTTYFTYDAFGRVTQATFPSTLVEAYGYDAVGNLLAKTDRKNQTIQYVYDALNRLTSKVYPDSTTANYVYDLVGKIQQVSDPTGTYGFAYDNMGRLIGTTTQYSFLPGFNFQNGYSYDAASNRKTLTAPEGSTNTYNYDTLNRLSTLTNSLTGQFGFGYDALDRRTQLTRPNGINTNYSYDSVSRLLSVLHQAGSTTLDGAGYGYDFAGNRTSKTNYLNNITEGYAYDLIYQLTQVTQGASTTESYSYDAVGNRLSSLGVNPYSYNASNQLTSTPSGSYTYDNNGNTVTDASGKSYTWDFENRLVSAVVPGTGTVTFKYDPFGRRIQKTSLLGTTNYLYDRANLLEEIDMNGNVLARYNGGLWIDESLSELRTGTSSYYQQDGVGSMTSLSNSAGTLANTYSYDSFGKLTNSSGTLANSFQFTGREFDAETSLRYYRFRYFDPIIGRFISEDPIGFDGGINFYRYVQNNPALLVDPFGLSSMTFDRTNGSLTLYDRNGHVVAVCTAANNTTRRSKGPWPNGTYPFSYHNNHSPDPNGPYGSYGIDIFDVPGRTGMGVHSGRDNSGGPSHPTLGCVRTTDNCMKQITDWQAHDPMETITIQ
jgi:RHS repeat-associated protein